jgi:hypothetical protein
MLATQQRLCEARPAEEPLWHSITAVILVIMTEHPAAAAGHVQLKSISPATADLVHKATEQNLAQLRAWVIERGAADGRTDALLQLNVAIATIMTALGQWQPNQDLGQVLIDAKTNIRALECAFT